MQVVVLWDVSPKQHLGGGGAEIFSMVAKCSREGRIYETLYGGSRKNSLITSASSVWNYFKKYEDAYLVNIPSYGT
jgi:hypothetical protein